VFLSEDAIRLKAVDGDGLSPPCIQDAGDRSPRRRWSSDISKILVLVTKNHDTLRAWLIAASAAGWDACRDGLWIPLAQPIAADAQPLHRLKRVHRQTPALFIHVDF